MEKFVTIDEAIDEVIELEIALIREKKAREQAEALLEKRANHLFNINQRLHDQYISTSRKNQEIDYLLKITNLETSDHDSHGLILNFLEITSKLLWTEASFAFKCDKINKKLIPVTNYIISPDTKEQEESEKKFLGEKFDFLSRYVYLEAPFVLSNFSNDISKIRSEYSHLNHSYLYPVVIDSDERFLIWLTFVNAVDLDDGTINLIKSGIKQLTSTLQKHKAKNQLLENYKKLKEIKSQLIQSEKMASLGTISAGIAHEINNPLSFLLTNSEVLKEYLVTIIQYINKLETPSSSPDEIQDLKKNIDYIMQDTPMLMNESLEGIERIKEIVNGLRTFSRADDGDIKDFDINTCVEAALRLVSNELKHKCKIDKKLESQSIVKGSAGQIIQVFTNLLVNSAQAIDGFGSVEITTQDKDENVIVTITDNGKGISKENLDQLFTPFFTTKPTGQGTGLGLSISYGIIKKHRGNIVVESNVGVGTSFHISIPITQGAA